MARGVAHGPGNTTAAMWLWVKPCCSAAPKTLQSAFLRGTSPAMPRCLPARAPVQPPWGAQGTSCATKVMTQLSQVLLNIIFLVGCQAELSAERKSAARGLSRARGTWIPGSILPRAQHHPPRQPPASIPGFKAIPGLPGPSCIKHLCPVGPRPPGLPRVRPQAHGCLSR